MIFIWNRKSFPVKLYQHPQEIWGQMIDWKFFKNLFSTLWKSRKSTNLIKFHQNFQFLTFVIFVAEISNKHCCKLDKILRNFSSCHFFVFVTVFKKFGFEICNFKHWSCDILERYCSLWTVNFFEICLATIVYRYFLVTVEYNKGSMY